VASSPIEKVSLQIDNSEVDGVAVAPSPRFESALTASTDDVVAVETLLGRRPMTAFEVVVRRADGVPVVTRNAPFTHDGTPMPTRYWLLPSAVATTAIGRMESSGGVRRAEAEIPAADIARAHSAYAADRDADIPTDWLGPRPTGGVGGTRVATKCLHAHYAHFLAGGDDPVGRWVFDQLAENERDIPAVTRTFDRFNLDNSEEPFNA
jgi:uncharacterized protein